MRKRGEGGCSSVHHLSTPEEIAAEGGMHYVGIRISGPKSLHDKERGMTVARSEHEGVWRGKYSNRLVYQPYRKRQYFEMAVSIGHNPRGALLRTASVSKTN